MFKYFLVCILQFEQIATKLVAVQRVMWRLRPRIVRYPEVRVEVQELGKVELDLRCQLRTAQIGLQISQQVISCVS